MRTKMHSSFLGALLPSVLVLTAFGAPQSFEFRLDDTGDWVQVEAPAEGTDEATIASARRDLAEDRPGRAKRILDEWIDAREEIGLRDDRLAEALRLRGDAKASVGDEFIALYDYERVIKEFSGTADYVIAIERELDIAVRYVYGLRRKTFGIRLFGTESTGEELLIRVQERMPGSVLAERAAIELADYYYRKRDLKLANEAYDLFLQNHPNSEFAKHAMRRRIYTTIGQFKGPEYDGSSLTDARVLIERFAAIYPDDAQQHGLDASLLARLDESGGAERLVLARWYLTRGEDVSARYVLERLVEKYPTTGAAVEGIRIMEDRGWVDAVGPALSESAGPIDASEGGADAPSQTP